MGEQPGRILNACTPGGQMEPFFREMSKVNGMAPQDPAFWRTYGMELIGRPLDVE